MPALVLVSVMISGLASPALADQAPEPEKVEKAAAAANPSAGAKKAAEKPETPAKDETFKIEAVVDSVSQPVNPHETIMTVTDSEMKAVEVIISPATRYEPGDYYPAEGDRIRLYYAVLGSVRKRQYAYVIAYVSEAGAAGRAADAGKAQDGAAAKSTKGGE